MYLNLDLLYNIEEYMYPIFCYFLDSSRFCWAPPWTCYICKSPFDKYIKLQGNNTYYYDYNNFLLANNLIKFTEKGLFIRSQFVCERTTKIPKCVLDLKPNLDFLY